MLIMTYWNPVVQYGVDRFADDLAAAGGAGPHHARPHPRRGAEWIAGSERTGLDRVFLAAPTSTDARIRAGRRREPRLRLRRLDDGHHRARAATSTGPRARSSSASPPPARPRAASASASRPAAQVAEVLEYADGAIVGSALVKALADGRRRRGRRARGGARARHARPSEVRSI